MCCPAAISRPSGLGTPPPQWVGVRRVAVFRTGGSGVKARTSRQCKAIHRRLRVPTVPRGLSHQDRSGAIDSGAGSIVERNHRLLFPPRDPSVPTREDGGRVDERREREEEGPFGQGGPPTGRRTGSGSEWVQRLPRPHRVARHRVRHREVEIRRWGYLRAQPRRPNPSLASLGGDPDFWGGLSRGRTVWWAGGRSDRRTARRDRARVGRRVGPTGRRPSPVVLGT